MTKRKKRLIEWGYPGVETRPKPLAEITEPTKVIVKDTSDGNRLYSKHCYGQPLPGGGLELTLLEAAYLLEQDKLAISNDNSSMDFQTFIDHMVTRTEVDFLKYIAYRDLKGRGFIVKFTSSFDFSLYPGGSPIRNTLSKKFVDVFSERHRFIPGEMFARVLRSQQLRKDYLVQVVDEEGDITYYGITIPGPTGNVPHCAPRPAWP